MFRGSAPLALGPLSLLAVGKESTLLRQRQSGTLLLTAKLGPASPEPGSEVSGRQDLWAWNLVEPSSLENRGFLESERGRLQNTCSPWDNVRRNVF